MTRAIKLIDQRVADGAVSRRCHECSACCVTLGVPTLDPPKPAGQPCAHCRSGRSGGGCSIEARKPDLCRSYACLWLRGLLDRSGRPDRLGLIFDPPGPGVFAAVAQHLGHPPLIARETFGGAAKLPNAQQALRSLAAKFLIVVVDVPTPDGKLPAKRLIYGPSPEAVSFLTREIMRLGQAARSTDGNTG